MSASIQRGLFETVNQQQDPVKHMVIYPGCGSPLASACEACGLAALMHNGQAEKPHEVHFHG